MTKLNFVCAGVVMGFVAACSAPDFTGRTAAQKKEQPKTEAANAAEVSQQSDSKAGSEGMSAVEKLLSASSENVIRSVGNKGLVAGCIPKQSKVTVSGGSNLLGAEAPLNSNFGWGSSESSAPPVIQNVVFEMAPCVAPEIKTEKLAFCELSSQTALPIECRKWSDIAGTDKAADESACKKKADADSGITTAANGLRSAPKSSSFFVCQKL
jgi:type II secretory pathway pseudopilin PulG